MQVPKALRDRFDELTRLLGEQTKAVVDAERCRAILAAQLESTAFAISCIEADAVVEPVETAKRRPLRQMVLEFFQSRRSTHTAEQVAEALGIRVRSVETAIAHWCSKHLLEPGPHGGYHATEAAATESRAAA